jgi:uncharacterized repeat protein (TIGR04138 family)
MGDDARPATMEQLIQEIADKAPCTRLAAQLVVTGLQLARERSGLRGERPGHVTAQQLCSAILETAKDYGPSQAATLQTAGIEHGEDIGRIVFSLIEQEMLSKQEGESVADFVGLFP